MLRHLKLVWLILGAAIATPLAAQSSIYSVVGFGFPTDALGVRARATAGGIAATDAESAINPAAVADFRSLTVVASTRTTSRGFEVDGNESDGLRETRFPLAMLGGNIPGTPISFAGSFAAYLDRTYDITVQDTLQLRGAPVAVTDRLRSRGAIGDVRGALGVRLTNRIAIGAAVHLINGSARLTARREFADGAYLPVTQETVERFSSVGVSAGVLLAPTNWLRFGAAVRNDTPLEISRNDAETPGGDLPKTVTAGLRLRLLRALSLSGSGQWQSWSEANDDLTDEGERAFDSWWVGGGLTLGGPEVGRSGLPLRVGVRYAHLPFSPTGEQPTELDVSFGTGLLLAGDRAVFDVAVERVMRDGGGASERAWQVSIGVVLQP